MKVRVVPALGAWRNALAHPARRRRSDRGFSLVEALVALAIAAGVMVAAYQGGSAALGLKQRSETQARAILIANDIAARLGRDIELWSGHTMTGEADGMSWRVAISGNPELSTGNDSVIMEDLLRADIAVFTAGASVPAFRITAYRMLPAVVRR